MGFLRVFGIIVGIVILLIGIVVVAARLSDGPFGLIAGGELTSGELVTGPDPDWRFVHDIETIEFQLLDPPRSRTTWILEHDGKIYIPCGYMDTQVGRLWKQWPIEAERDGRAVIRVAGKRYERELVRIHDGPSIEPLVKQINEKYGAPARVAEVTSNSLWLFELKPTG